MRVSPRTSSGRRLGGLGGPLLILVLALGGAAGGCTGDYHAAPGATATAMPSHAGNGPDAAPTPHPVPAGEAIVPTAEEISAAWGARPAFVTAASGETQAAYAYALTSPHVVQWLPCYCGCGGFGHASNLDCFIQPRDEADDPLLFEEHGSYCDVCVKTALMADQMLRDGSTLLQVRAAVDATFGGLAPGTPTELPPG
jgi:hypothetical protein